MVLLMTTSMSYKRYLNMAMPIAAGTITSAIPGRTFPPTPTRGLFAMMAATRNALA